MSPQTVRRAGLALTALLVLYGLSFVLRGGGGGSEGTEVSGALTDMAASLENGVTIHRADGAVQLSHDGGGWRVNGFPADSFAVERFRDVLTTVSVGSLAARNPSNHSRLEVTDQAAIRVESHEGTALLVGKAGPQIRSAFVRLQETPETYLVSGGLRGALDRSELDWREKTMLTVDPTVVHEITLIRNNEQTTLTRSEAGWTAGGAFADSAAITAILEELSNLEATGFSPDGEPQVPVTRSLVARDSQGAVVADVSIGDNENTPQVTTSGSDVVFHIPTWRVDRLVPRRRTLFTEQERP